MMLSTISHSMPPSFEPSSAPPPDMTTALPIIPCKPRPKLSVNTSTPRSFGKGASLRLDTLSAVSPTKINTFCNAYPPSKPRLSIDSNFPVVNSASATPSSASTLSSALTASSSDSATISIPYKQPHNVVSILSNTQIVPRRMASSRPMFPAEKRVSFRTPLEEEIQTTKYTLAHSDLESSVSTISSIASSTSTHSESSTVHDSTSSNPSRKRPSPPQSPGTSSSTFASLEGSPRPKAPRVGDKRDSSSSEDESDTCPVTPVAGRRKRTRDWKWTLGTLPGPSAPASSTSDATTSEDSS